MILTAGLGLLVGGTMGLTGAGGGIIAIPMLVFGLNLTVSQAGPIGLLAVGTAAVGAALGTGFTTAILSSIMHSIPTVEKNA